MYKFKQGGNYQFREFGQIRGSSPNLYLFLWPAFCFFRWYCHIKISYSRDGRGLSLTRKTSLCALCIFDKVLFFLQKRKKFSKIMESVVFISQLYGHQCLLFHTRLVFSSFYAWSNLCRLLWRILQITLSIFVGKYYDTKTISTIWYDHIR